MSDPVPFLTSLGHALAAIGLYADGHPARQRALEASLEELEDLATEDPHPQFTFLGGEVVYRGRILRGLPHWEWATQMAAIGIERLEFLGSVSSEEYQRFLADAHRRVQGHPTETALARQFAQANIRYGQVTMGQQELAHLASAAVATIGLSLKDEAETIRWLHDEVQTGAALPLVETETVVRSLAFTMHAENRLMLPLLQLKEFDEYTTTHASNVAVLAMGLAEYVGLGPREVRAIGVAGLLHDLGKVKIPKEILLKPGSFTPEELDLVRKHPAEGARLILDYGQQLDLAAVVAYEHHLWLNDEGYPALRFARDAHYVSRLVHVCDIYDALCTDRPYRDALRAEAAIALIGQQAGTGLDPQLASAFIRMMGEARLQQVSLRDPVVSVQA